MQAVEYEEGDESDKCAADEGNSHWDVQPWQIEDDIYGCKHQRQLLCLLHGRSLSALQKLSLSCLQISKLLPEEIFKKLADALEIDYPTAIGETAWYTNHLPDVQNRVAEHYSLNELYIELHNVVKGEDDDEDYDEEDDDTDTDTALDDNNKNYSRGGSASDDQGGKILFESTASLNGSSLSKSKLLQRARDSSISPTNITDTPINCSDSDDYGDGDLTDTVGGSDVTEVDRKWSSSKGGDDVLAARVCDTTTQCINEHSLSNQHVGVDVRNQKKEDLCVGGPLSETTRKVITTPLECTNTTDAAVQSTISSYGDTLLPLYDVRGRQGQYPFDSATNEKGWPLVLCVHLL